MPADLRRYLLDRFTSDAVTLRARAASLRTPEGKGATKNAPKRVPGPDAAESLRMAVACEDVVAILAALPVHEEVTELLSALEALAPLLDARAASASNDALVRSVYAGAATRLREVVRAESGSRGDVRDDGNDDDDAEDDDE